MSADQPITAASPEKAPKYLLFNSQDITDKTLFTPDVLFNNKKKKSLLFIDNPLSDYKKVDFLIGFLNRIFIVILNILLDFLVLFIG